MTAADETLAGLLRTLRLYADSPIGAKLSDQLAAWAEQGRAGLVAMEPGSQERLLEAVLISVHMKLSILVLDMRLEIGEARLEARRFLEDLDPGDFGAPS